jgi:hypothetical protein
MSYQERWKLHNVEFCDNVLLTKYSGDQFKKNEVGGACDVYEGQKGCVVELGGENWGKETT